MSHIPHILVWLAIVIPIAACESDAPTPTSVDSELSPDVAVGDAPDSALGDAPDSALGDAPDSAVDGTTLLDLATGETEVQQDVGPEISDVQDGEDVLKLEDIGSDDSDSADATADSGLGETTDPCINSVTPPIALELGDDMHECWFCSRIFTAPTDGSYVFYYRSDLDPYWNFANYSSFTNNSIGLDTGPVFQDACVGGEQLALPQGSPPQDVHTSLFSIVDMVAGQTVLVEMDASTKSADTALRVEGPCVADCSSKACGHDGCGGYCPNTCPAGQPVCVLGECTSVPAGESCSNPDILSLDALPMTVLSPCAAFLAQHPDLVDCPGYLFPKEVNLGNDQCPASELPIALTPGYYIQGADWVYAVTAPSTDSYTFTLTPNDAVYSGGNVTLTMLDTCDVSAECLGVGFGSGWLEDFPIEVTVELVQDQTYYLVASALADPLESSYSAINAWSLHVAESSPNN